MTKEQYIHKIKKEVKQLNEVIDFKIIHGMRYVNEARRHRILLQKIRAQRPNKFYNLFFQF